MVDKKERFYDLVYEAWCAGKNPDLISRERYDGHIIDGYYPEDITMDMCQIYKNKVLKENN